MHNFAETDQARLTALLDELRQLAEGMSTMRIMEFCGGHTHALVNSGIMSVLPPNVQMVHGPGCPVCVLPANHLQAALDLIESNPQITLLVYGDVMRIPTLGGDTLLNAKGRGLSVKMVYSPLEIIAMAENEPERQFIFMAIGFETTAPATALLLREARRKALKNVSALCLHVLTPPAFLSVMDSLEAHERPQALIGPGHVSMVTGLGIYHGVSEQYQIPVTISGFEAEDLLESLVIIVRNLREKRWGVTNQYTRALKPEGNTTAQELLNNTFELRPWFTWRGLGALANSAYQLKAEWAPWDAEKRFTLNYRDVPEHPACKCGEILRGKQSPRDCKLFMKACTPSRPLGSCMVSSEGACHAYQQMGAYIGATAASEENAT